MSTSLKINADTKDIKKSLLDLNRDVANLGKTKVSLFSNDEKDFIKNQLKASVEELKKKLTESKDAATKLVQEHAKLTKDTQDELNIRKQIVDRYREQANLAREISSLSKSNVDPGMGGGGVPTTGASGGMGGMGGLTKKLAGLGLALTAMGYVGSRVSKGGSMFDQTLNDRVRLGGMGVENMEMGSSLEDRRRLGRAGLSEGAFLQRQLESTSRLGRDAGSTDNIFRQAEFERAYGLEGGSTLNMATSLRSSLGGQGAQEAQFKLQSMVMASGMEDAIAPYLETMTSLLGDINETGLNQTDQLVAGLTQLTKEGGYSVERLSTIFGGIDSAVKGSTGESNAFFQSAFAKAGIGGGTVGGTKLAIESGGILGLSEDELRKRGYNEQLIENMRNEGQLGNTNQRTGAILSEAKTMGGLGAGQRIQDITDTDTKTQLQRFMNAQLGTTGETGFEALQLMEKFNEGQVSRENLEKEMNEIMKKDTTPKKLDDLNATSSAILAYTKLMTENTLIMVGKSSADARKIMEQVQTVGDTAIGGTAEGVTDFAKSAVSSPNLFARETKFDAVSSLVTPSVQAPAQKTDLSEATTEMRAMRKALEKQKSEVTVVNRNNNSVRVQNSDGTITDRVK